MTSAHKDSEHKSIQNNAISSRNIIITASNDAYLPLALGLLRSLRKLSFAAPFDIGIIDVGLSDEAKAQLAAFSVSIVPAQIDFDYPDRLAWEEEHPAFRSLTCRPYLRSYFPNYDVYMWIDADAWAQTPDAVNTMLEGAASDNSLYAIAEIDRDYNPYFLSSQPWQLHFTWYSTNFPAAEVAAIFPRPMLNAGVWAMNKNSPVWQAWRATYAACLQRFSKMTREQFMTDQLSLNMAVYTHGLPLKVMPAEFNWLSLFCVPMFDETKNLFIRPTPPRSVISILHLTHEKKLRDFDLLTPQGSSITRSLMQA